LKQIPELKEYIELNPTLIKCAETCTEKLNNELETFVGKALTLETKKRMESIRF